MSATFVVLITLLVTAASLLIGLLIVRIRQGYPQIVHPAQNLQFRRAHSLMLVTAATIWITALGILITQWTSGAPPAGSNQISERVGDKAAAGEPQIAPVSNPDAMPVAAAAAPPVTEPLPAPPAKPEPVAAPEKVAPEVPKPQPAPELAHAAPAAPAAAPKPRAPRPLIVDTGTSDLALQVRDAPDGYAIGRVRNGELVEPLSSAVQFADGRPWIRIRTKAGLVGWVVRASTRPAGVEVGD